MGYNFVIGKEKALGNSTVKWYACNFEILGLPDIVWPISISRFATIWACSVAESLSLQIGTLCYPPTQASPKYKSVTSVNIVLRLPDLCKPKAAQKIRRNKSTAEWCALSSFLLLKPWHFLVQPCWSLEHDVNTDIMIKIHTHK